MAAASSSTQSPPGVAQAQQQNTAAQPQQQKQPMQQNSQPQGQPPPTNSQATSGVTAVPPATASEGRKISCEDIQLVQNLIERCLQLYMNRTEVISTLLNQAKIEPGFSGLVWQKLEEQNPDFFKAYYVRLKLKRQIIIFNQLLEQHAQLTQKIHPVKVSLPSLQNGMHTTQVHHMPIGYPVPQQPHIAAAGHPHMVPMPVASLSAPVLSGTQAPEAFGVAHRSPGSNGVANMNTEMSMLTTASHIPLSNDLSMGSATGMQGSSSFPFATMGNPTDISGIGMDVPSDFPPDTTLHSSESHSQNGIGAFQIGTDADAPGGRESLGLLETFPRSFSLSDITAELANSTDILGSYSGSPFLGADSDVFIQSSDDEKMHDQITVPAVYDDFEDVK